VLCVNRRADQGLSECVECRTELNKDCLNVLCVNRR